MECPDCRNRRLGHLIINNKEIEACSLELIELYKGKKPEWKGWHNLILNISDKPGDTKVIAGPIDPETSKQLQVSINAVKEEIKNEVPKMQQ